MAALDPRSLQAAAQAIREADALLIAAGAGMGVDSGLPDFRGPEGFWRAYPAARALGLRFEQLADPRWFRRDPALAWGFYGHRSNLYRETAPHAGFARLRGWMQSKPLHGFVFTSNVDGHFQAAGFDPARIVECHSSIHHLQCTLPCSRTLWPMPPARVDIDAAQLRAREPLPRCAHCGALARPNILMFGDGDWIEDRTEAQYAALQRFLDGLRAAAAKLCVIELGAGSAVPTVRLFSERLQRSGAALVRINPREPEVPRGGIGLAAGAAAALDALAPQL